MKILSIIFGCLFLSINITIGQTASLKYLPYNGKVGTQYSYDAEAEVVRNRTTHDYGPRDKTVNGVYDAYDWHGGIDYNTVSPFNGQDRGNIGLAVEGGTVVETGLSGSTHFIVVNGTHKTAYVHIWDGCSSIHDGATHYYEGCIVKPMDGNNSSQWALIFRINGAYSAIGSVKNFPATVTFSDNGTNQTINVTDYVAAGSPVAPIGTSCSSKFPYHYHVQAITDINNGLSDGNDKNALEYIQNNENSLVPNYNVSLRNQNGNVGVQLVDDGSKKSTLSARIDLDPAQSNNGSVEDYNIVINHEKVEFYLKKPNGEKIQVQGPDYDKIQIGGKTGSNVIPDYMNKSDSKPNADIIGKWTQSGIEPHCYNEHRYDDYFLYNFVKRIHTDDIMGDNNLQLAICPDEARFPDGKYDVLAKMTTITDATFDSPSITTIVDNFKPYIKSVTITANGKAYVRNVSCGTCGIELGAATGDPFSSADLANGFTVSATISEPMHSFQLEIAAIGYTGVFPSSAVASNNNQTFLFTVPASVSMPTSGKVILRFNGLDLGTNQILNLSTITGCHAIPIRTGTADNWNTFISGGGEISFSFPICNTLVVPIACKMTPASSCSAGDGKLTPTVTGNVIGLTFEWFWFRNGTWQLMGPGFNNVGLSFLFAGDYKIVATNKEGCKGELEFEVTSPDRGLAFSKSGPCNQTDATGSITAYTSSTPNLTFDFVWQGPNGQISSTIGQTYSTINNLKIGTYYVSVSKSGSPSEPCARMYQVKLGISTMSSKDITAIVKNTCVGKTNGSITLNTQNFGTPFSVVWASPVPTTNKTATKLTNLSVGTYQVTVKNHCGQSATQSFEIKNAGTATIKVTSNTDCTTDLSVDIPDGTPPYTYFWTSVYPDRPGKTSIIKDVKSNAPHVTVTDSNGCVFTAENIEVPYYKVNSSPACEGNNGFINVYLHNPSDLAVSIKAFGIDQKINPFMGPSNHHTFRSVNVSGTPGIIVPIEISIGNCKTTQDVAIISLPTKKVFKKYSKKADLCEYYETCNGIRLTQKGGLFNLFNVPIIHTEKPLAEFKSYNNFGFVKCGDERSCVNFQDTTKTIKFPIKKDFSEVSKVGEFISFLEAKMLENSNLIPLYTPVIQKIKSDIANSIADALYKNKVDSTWAANDPNHKKTLYPHRSLCDKVDYCPLKPTDWTWTPYQTYVSISVNVIVPDSLKQFFSYIGVTDDNKPNQVKGSKCWEYKCGEFAETTCPKNVAVPDPPNDAPSNCDPHTEYVAQLYIWLDDLKANYPKFKDSDLEAFLDKNKDDERTNCTQITYCKKDFRVTSYPKLSKVKCVKMGGYSKLNVRTCEKVSIEKNPGKAMIVCFNGFGKYGTAFDTTMIFLNTDTKYNPIKPQGGENSRILANLNPTTFKNWAWIKEKNIVTPHGIIEGSKENYFYNYIPYDEVTSILPIDNHEYYYSDFDTAEKVRLIEQSDTSVYTLIYQKGEEDWWTSDIEGSEYLKIKQVEKLDDGIQIAGFFTGILFSNEEIIYSSESRTAFIMKIDNKGNIADFHSVANLDAANTQFYVSNGNINILAKGNNEDVIVLDNGKNVIESKNNISNIDFSNNQNNAQINFNGDINCLDVLSYPKTGRMSYLITNSSNSKASVQNIAIATDESYLLSYNEKQTLIWRIAFKGGTLSSNFLDMVCDKEGNTYVGLSFFNSIRINGTEYKSKGGSDILLLKINSKGSIEKVLQYGSPDDENVSNLYYLNGIISFAGNISGSSPIRQIGNTTFYFVGLSEKEAYITNVDEYDFRATTILADSKVEKAKVNVPIYRQNDSKIWNVNIMPNPFDNTLTVEVECNEICSYDIILRDVIGRVVWSKLNTKNAKFKSNYTIDNADKLEAGIYFMEVIDEQGNKIVNKVIKQ